MIDEAEALAHHGITFGEPQIDLDKLRDFKTGVVKKLTGGLAGMAKARKVEVVRGVGTFVDPNHMEVDDATAARRSSSSSKAIIAAGSQAVKLPFMPEDPRVVDSTGALELRQIPKRMLVIGGGIIGLEMATVYSTLGAQHRRGRNARRPDGRRRPRSRQGLGEVQRASASPTSC